MADVKTWSVTAGSNNSASPDGFPEGMAPSGVNDSAREVMAAVRKLQAETGYITRNHTVTWVSSTQLSITDFGGDDDNALYFLGNRVRVSGTATGDIHGTITASSYSAPDRSITLAFDSGSMTNEALTVATGEGNHSSRPVAGVSLDINNALTGSAIISTDKFLRYPSADGANKRCTGAELTTFILDQVIPAGTRMLFHQAAAPTGWTISSSAPGRMIISAGTINDGVVGGGDTGGADLPDLMDKTPVHTHTFGATTSSDGSHSHTVNDRGAFSSTDGGIFGNIWRNDLSTVTGSAGSHTHTVNGTSDNNSGSSNWEPKYTIVILASKN